MYYIYNTLKEFHILLLAYGHLISKKNWPFSFFHLVLV